MQVTANFRPMHVTAKSIEAGSTGLNAADQEVADRRKRDQNEYIRERDDVLVNNLPQGRLKALEKHISLMHQLDDALIGKPSCFSEFDPELKNAIEKKNTYGELLQAEKDFYRKSWKTQGWNLVAGGNGFLLCFGVGTVLSNALGMPWLALVISPVIWSFTERLIPMIRATSWRNKHADVDYPHIMRISAQKIRDQVRQMFGLNAKKYIVNGKVLTAAQYREVLSLFNAWKGKVKTDDLPYFSYSFWYSVRTVILNLCASPAFLKTPGGVAVSLLSLAVAGIFAGASTSVIAQTCRRHAYKKENPGNWRNGEFLVKSPNVWKAERNLLKAKFALMDAYLEKYPDKKTCKSFEFSRVILNLEMLKLGMKSERLTSIAYEISRLAQEESAFGEDGFSDVAGSRIDALCGLMGKAACLVPAVLFNQLMAMKYTSAGFGVVTGISVTLALNILLIMGFSFRKELEFPGRYMVEFVYACVDALNDAHGETDKYANNGTPGLVESVTPPSGSDVDSQSENVGDSDDAIPANCSPVLPRRLNLADQPSPDGTMANDEESSDDS